MKMDISSQLVHEHRLILRMLTLLERNANLLAQGEFGDYRFFIDGVDFIRNYADRFHHAKEEDVLFVALVANGMPREHSPVAAMLMEHDQGRAYVKAMCEAAARALDGEAGQEAAITENALGYVALLRDHIAKEDDILYPLAERVLPEEVRPAMVEAYHKADGSIEEHYRKVVEHYEQAGR
ncbi:hemerythrin domain-containing protein [Geomesophilobacter sediminis]|uniref:Hemerythrin domain-containing protein n=1 Tax=Geomesophilobacter sediminis TaxID=2798584 RepID=A0A8J7JE63_9BACT|nr:hemerythrin domain-containing protein [Geomesophilobacter sediminis]MBJ6724209.1 hemerythrin domain-containing protein [Geomesophilobacter sediminis]